MRTPPDSPANGVAQVFLLRAQRALRELADKMSEPELAAAASEAFDSGVLLSALGSGSGIAALSHDPLAEARLRGLRMKHDLLQREGGIIGAGEMGETLGISRQAVHKRVKARTLFAVQTARHGYAFPVWQLDGDAVLPGLADTLRALDPRVDSWMTLAFFLNEHSALDGRTPLAALREGDGEAVLRCARNFGQHVAL